MEYAEVVRRRRMVRRFADRPLPPDVIERILTSALRAPSAGFSQGWEFLVLTDEADRNRFWPFVPNQTAHTPDMMNAPLVVVPLAHKAAYLERYPSLPSDEFWPAPYWFVDAGMASLLMLLTAVDEGLGAFFFWIMAPASRDKDDPEAIPAHLVAFRAEFGIPEAYAPVGAIAIGYRPDDLAPQPTDTAERRRDPREVFHRGQFGSFSW